MGGRLFVRFSVKDFCGGFGNWEIESFIDRFFYFILDERFVF